MLLKQGISISGCRAEILIAGLTIIDPIFRQFGKESVITSGTERYKHSATRSRHYSGDALDFRHRWFDYQTKVRICDELTLRLGKHFVVVLESSHFHIHFAPIYEA